MTVGTAATPIWCPCRLRAHGALFVLLPYLQTVGPRLRGRPCRPGISRLVRCALAQSVPGAGQAATAPGPRRTRPVRQQARVVCAVAHSAQPARAAAKPLRWARGSCPDPPQGSAVGQRPAGASATGRVPGMAAARRWVPSSRNGHHGPPSGQALGASIWTVPAAT
jgi:hypothetical protein